MAPRANWKGYLKLSLVSCSVALYSATTTSERIRFNILNKKTGNRVRNLVIDSETEEPVEQEDRVKGYQFEKGQYIQVEDDELAAAHIPDIEAVMKRHGIYLIRYPIGDWSVPTNGRSFRTPLKWIERARSSLPTPGSMDRTPLSGPIRRSIL